MRLITAKPLQNAVMNSTNVTTCGYAGSDMVGILEKDSCKAKTTAGQGTLDKIYNDYIEPDFGDTHVLEYRNLLTTKVDETATNNRMGGKDSSVNQKLGASSWWGFYPRKLDLMSEMNVYGGIVTSSSLFDTGIDNRQYALFRLKPELINSYDGQTFYYWLKDVASKTDFARVRYYGSSETLGANYTYGVRPRFLIGYSSI